MFDHISIYFRRISRFSIRIDGIKLGFDLLDLPAIFFHSLLDDDDSLLEESSLEVTAPGQTIDSIS
jgi:hypothetical protein